ncbi:hypothetical protein V8F20_010689 [Naviculisporaceae sp. PSN 640]
MPRSETKDTCKTCVVEMYQCRWHKSARCKRLIAHTDDKKKCPNFGKPGHKPTYTFPKMRDEDLQICKHHVIKDPVHDASYVLENKKTNDGFFQGRPNMNRAQTPASNPPSPGYNPPINNPDYVNLMQKTPKEVYQERAFYTSDSEAGYYRTSSSEPEQAQGKGKGKDVQGGGSKPNPAATVGPSGGQVGGGKRRREDGDSGSGSGGPSRKGRAWEL